MSAGALLLVLALGGLLMPETRLVLMDDDGEARLAAASLTLRYRHSVQRTVVEEDLAADARGVRVVETRFSSFGAGLPSQPEWGGRFAFTTAGVMAVQGMTAVLPEILVRVGHVSEQTAIAGDTSVPLNEVVRPGGRVTIRAVTLPRALWWMAR